MDHPRIEHRTQLTREEKEICNASTSEIILYNIVHYPHYLFGGILLSLFLYIYNSKKQ